MYTSKITGREYNIDNNDELIEYMNSEEGKVILEKLTDIHRPFVYLSPDNKLQINNIVNAIKYDKEKGFYYSLSLTNEDKCVTVYTKELDNKDLVDIIEDYFYNNTDIFSYTDEKLNNKIIQKEMIKARQLLINEIESKDGLMLTKDENNKDKIILLKDNKVIGYVDKYSIFHFSVGKIEDEYYLKMRYKDLDSFISNGQLLQLLREKNNGIYGFLDSSIKRKIIVKNNIIIGGNKKEDSVYLQIPISIEKYNDIDKETLTKIIKEIKEGEDKNIEDIPKLYDMYMIESEDEDDMITKKALLEGLF